MNQIKDSTLLVQEANRLATIFPDFWNVVNQNDATNYLQTGNEDLKPVFFVYLSQVMAHFQWYEQQQQLQQLQNIATAFKNQVAKLKGGDSSASPNVSQNPVSTTNVNLPETKQWSQFQHTDEDSDNHHHTYPSNVCWHFLNNRCHFGSRCRKYHPPDLNTTSNPVDLPSSAFSEQKTQAEEPKAYEGHDEGQGVPCALNTGSSPNNNNNALSKNSTKNSTWSSVVQKSNLTDSIH